MGRAQLITQVEVNADRLAAHPDIDAIIVRHYETLMSHYLCKPYFYKNVLKLDRLLVVLAMFCHYHTEPFPSLSRVKEFCERRGYLSKNSLESFFLFFTTAGYMDLHDHPEDGRQRVFKPSALALMEARKIVSSYYSPLTALGLDNKHTELDHDEVFHAYFVGFDRLLSTNITVDVLVPDCHWIMNKDGGHMLMLALYVDGYKHPEGLGGYKISTYAELSSRLSVSSSHLIRLVKEGEKKGYFKRYKNMVEVSESFIELVRRAMVYCFAITLTSIQVGRVETEG